MTKSTPRPGGLERHDRLIAAATDALKADRRVLAAWLVGSLTTDQADAVSDIDLHILVRSEDLVALREGWADLVHTFTPTVSTRSFPSGTGGYAITPEWMHLDLAVHGGTPTIHDGSGFTPLFDRSEGALPTHAKVRSIEVGDPWFPSEAVHWFFYMLGNLAVVVARDEPVLGTNGAVMLRDTCLVPLMYAESGVTRTGGNKRLRAFLTTEQHLVLEGLPDIAPNIRSVVDAYAATAQIFVERGRRLAERTGGVWPEAFERATANHLERFTGRRIPS